MKLIALLLIFILVNSCKSSPEDKTLAEKTTAIASPDVRFDTISDPDFLIDTSNLFKKDSILIKYNDSIVVKHKQIRLFGRNYYLVEGDLLLNEYKYNQYRISILLQKSKVKKMNTQEIAEFNKTEKAALRIDLINNKPARWPEGDTITYCINRNTFNNLSKYRLIIDYMNTATKDWMSTCNVVFQYKPELDSKNYLFGNEKVDFVVLEYNSGADFVAKAFFPLDPIEEKNLVIDPSYYISSYNPIGVLRHELGHVLGWRHEHISTQAPAACPDEIISGTVELTSYDPKSVMHYYCGGVGSTDLKISEKDKIGAQQIYGLPIIH